MLSHGVRYSSRAGTRDNDGNQSNLGFQSHSWAPYLQTSLKKTSYVTLCTCSLTRLRGYVGKSLLDMRMLSVTFSYDGIDFEKEDGHDERIKVHFVDMRDSEARIKAFADLKQKQCFDGGSRQRSNSQKSSSGKDLMMGKEMVPRKKCDKRQTLFDIVKSLGVPMGVNAFARSSSGGRRGEEIRLIACGGDGTSGFSELKKRQLLHLGIASCPPGTGNDLRGFLT